MTNHYGKIISINPSKGFGYIYSEINKQDYPFDISSCNGKIKINDDVIFILNKEKKRTFASNIRKVYINKYGLKFVARINSNHIHLDLNTYLLPIINHIKNSDDEYISREFKFPNIIGKTKCVKTDSNDEIIYAIRKSRLGHTRFVLHRQAEDCNYITCILKKVDDYYLIISIFIGRKPQPEPWDKKATASSFEFWNNHALIYDEEDIVEGSIRKTCPWDVIKK